MLGDVAIQFANENGLHVSGYVSDGKGSYRRCTLDFHLYH